MNGKMRMLIICAVFALISSCKYYASGEDLKQNVKKQIIKGFLDTKEGVVSDDPTVYEIAEKLKEEEKQETKEELIRGDDPNNINKAQILQANSQDSKPELEAVQQSESGGQQKEEEKKEEQKDKAKAEEVEAKEEQAKAKAEQERKEKGEQQKRQEEERQVKIKIETLTKKIDEINSNIDSIKYKRWFMGDEKRLEVKATEVRDKVTGPVYDHFTNDPKQAIYYTWGLDEEESLELTKLLKQLRDTRDRLRTKLNENNATYTLEEPKLKENVKIDEIESDLYELKSELENVKEYLKNESNFEEIKEYVANSEY